MRQLQSGWSADREVARRMKTVVVTTVRARVAAAPRTHFAIKMLWPTTPPLDVQLDGEVEKWSDYFDGRCSRLPDERSRPSARRSQSSSSAGRVVVRWGPFKSCAASRGRSELEVSVPPAFQRSGPTRLSTSSAAPQAVGRLHVPRQRGFVRRPDDFRRNLIGRKSRCAHHRLGIAKPRQLTARPNLRLRSFFQNSAGAGGVGFSTLAIYVARAAQRALCAVSRKAGIFCRPLSPTPNGDGTGMPGICRTAAPTWMKAGRISSICQYFETDSRSSSSVTWFGLVCAPGGKAPCLLRTPPRAGYGCPRRSACTTW